MGKPVLDLMISFTGYVHMFTVVDENIESVLLWINRNDWGT